MKRQPNNQPDQPPTPDGDTASMLACLRAAVADVLERKRRLGQYSVQWSPEGPMLSGPDVPGCGLNANQ